MHFCIPLPGWQYTSYCLEVEYLIYHANKGSILYSGISLLKPVIFVIAALMPLVFICAVIGILKYFGILRTDYHHYRLSD